MLRQFILLALVMMATSSHAVSPAEEPVVQAVQKVLPAVVNIFTEGYVEHRVVDPIDQFYYDFFGGGFSRGSRIVKTPIRNLGSGLLVSAEGHIVTNHHVVRRASDFKIKVTLNSGEEYDAKVLHEDEYADLALIKIDRSTPFTFLNLQNTSPNLLGQTVIAIGNPIGYESSVSKGILSAQNRSLSMDGFSMEGLLQTDAAINPGNSGGPLVDINGLLVGINTAKMGTSRNVIIENIGFAIPAERVKAFVEDAKSIAKGERPTSTGNNLAQLLEQRLGLKAQNLTPELADAFGYKNIDGVLISDVSPDSPASLAGIEKGMLLVGIGPYRTPSMERLPRQLNRMKKGDTVRVTLAILARHGQFVIQRMVSVNLQAQ